MRSFSTVIVHFVASHFVSASFMPRPCSGIKNRIFHQCSICWLSPSLGANTRMRTVYLFFCSRNSEWTVSLALFSMHSNYLLFPWMFPRIHSVARKSICAIIQLIRSFDVLSDVGKKIALPVRMTINKIIQYSSHISRLNILCNYGLCFFFFSLILKRGMQE